jgi:hypothetical protein
MQVYLSIQTRSIVDVLSGLSDIGELLLIQKSVVDSGIDNSTK